MTALRTRDEMLEARVAALGDYVLSLECYPGCERPAMLALRTLSTRYGQLQLRAVLRQLKCSRCKRPPAQVTIVDHVMDGEKPTFRLVLT